MNSRAVVETIVGDEYVEECQTSEVVTDTVFTDTVTTNELKQIREAIKSIVRPQYRRGPPANLGDPKHGKLKAAQWKVAIEFDLPVAIAQHWSREVCIDQYDNNTVEHRDKCLKSIMFLATAIRWGTSYRTSAEHAQKCRENMQAYLQSLIDLYPDMELRPSHHASLHIPELLIQFGPVQGWWMFPFERVIGQLQKIKTNNKFGECRQPMLEITNVVA